MSKKSSKNPNPDPVLQERSLVAASHRDSRSLEGRMESAEKASELHFQRTGKYLDISEEAVMGKEQYEEIAPAPAKKKSTAHATAHHSEEEEEEEEEAHPKSTTRKKSGH